MTSPYADWTLDQKIAQAKEWRANGWSIAALADEFDISDTMVYVWTDDGYKAKHRAWTSNWNKSEKGRAYFREYRRRNKLNVKE